MNSSPSYPNQDLTPHLPTQPLPLPVPNQQEAAQFPVSKRRKLEHKVVVTVRVDDNSAKHKPDGPPSDFWSWRKYGQKPIKGSPYPRGYYRCSTSKGCSAKKQVERCRTDASLLVVTYTSSHNHEGPDLHHITSEAAPEEDKPLDDMKTGRGEALPSPDTAHDSSLRAHVEQGSNTHQSNCLAAAEARHGVSEEDDCKAGVASALRLKDDNDHVDAAGSDLPCHQASCCYVGGEEGKVSDVCDTGSVVLSPESTNASHDHAGGHLDHHMNCCSDPPPQGKLVESCNGEEDQAPRPSLTSVSGRNVLSSEDSLCPEPPTAYPTICCQAEDLEPTRPPSPLSHSPQEHKALDTDTQTTNNHTLQPEEVPFDEDPALLPPVQSGSSSEEFDFYDELEELPTISPWTSTLMGSFFDERILLPS